MTTEQKIIRAKVGLLELAKQYSALELLPSRRRRMWEFVGYVEKVWI